MAKCKHCKTEFTPKHRGNLFCAKECGPAFAREIYKNEKMGVFEQPDKPIVTKRCRQCGDEFKTQTRANYCHEGCTSKKVKGKFIDKNQIKIKHEKPLIMKDIFGINERFKETPAPAPTPQRGEMFKKADEEERRVFEWLLKSYPDRAFEANFTSLPQKSTDIYQGEGHVPKPDITMYAPAEDGKTRVILIDVKHVKMFNKKEVLSLDALRTKITVERHLLAGVDYNHYLKAKELMNADDIWIAFVHKDEVFFSNMVEDGVYFEEKKFYNYYKQACMTGGRPRKGMAGPFKLGK